MRCMYYLLFFYYKYSALGPGWQEPEPNQATGMALVRCVLGRFLGVGCHCFPLPLDVLTLPPDAPTFSSTRALLVAKGGNIG
jgi:hypothetical protein